jgi:small GTP-binding protein
MYDDEIQEIKVILLGETAVGKTSIIKRYYDDTFDTNEVTTISMSYVDKIIELNKMKYKLIIWDTIGQEKYRSISKLFLTEAKIVILVYCIDKKDTFENLDFWYNLYKEELGDEAILGIAGNKADLLMEQVVSYQEGEKFANERGAIFAEISAKENKVTINNFMNDLVKAYIAKNKGEKINNNNKVKLGEGNNQKKEGCCGKSKSKGK